MNPFIANTVLILIIIAIVLGIVYYLYKAKKRGETCIGCPYAKQCAKKSCNCSGNGTTAKK